MYAFFPLIYSISSKIISLNINQLKKSLLIFVNKNSPISQKFDSSREIHYFGVILNITMVIAK